MSELASKIVIATNFLYPDYSHSLKKRDISDTDGIRGSLALETINKATKAGFRIVAADGGSSQDFLSEMEQYKDSGLVLIHSEATGRGPQRRDAFKTASLIQGTEVIVYIQPEKSPIIEHLGEISAPILKKEADVVIPNRNSELYESTYPDYMRQSELKVNFTYNWLMQRSGLMGKDQSFDWFFGPLAFINDPEILNLFLKKYVLKGSIYNRSGYVSNPEINSNNHFFPVIESLFNNKNVIGVEIPFEYPSIQKINEVSDEQIDAFRDKRREQSAVYRLEALHFLAYLKGNPKSKIIECYS